MRSVSVPLIERVPDYQVREGLVHVVVEGCDIVAFPVKVFKQGIAKSQVAIDDYEAALAGRVIPFVGGGRK